MSEIENETISTFRKNATQEVRCSIGPYKGTECFNLWIFYQDISGIMRASKQGLSLSFETYPGFREAVMKLIEVMDEQVEIEE